MMRSMPTSLKLKAQATARVLRGHPWVFANEVVALPPPEADGEVVECRDARGRFLGTGICNSRSQIVWRRLSRDRVALDEAYLRSTLERALERRNRRSAIGVGLGADSLRRDPLSDGTEGAARPRPDEYFGRLVWSESDDLPGIVVDQYGDTLVLQTQTLAMEKRLDLLLSLLGGLLKPAEIVLRNDASVRRLEGLPLEVRTLSGRPWEPRWLRIDGLEYWLDLLGGQKTGFYLDQREQHAKVAGHVARLVAEGKPPRVLDAFCNQGPFALHCARAGAAAVRGLDSAAEAIAQARRNTERNGVRVEFLEANVFDYFTANREEAWDLIVLDPPPFAKSRGALAGAMRGYKEINLRAMQRLTPDGVLATYSCSHHVQEADFRAVLAEAAADAKRRVHVLEFCHQPADHPVLVTMPESEYLRGCILRVE
jgi:23S rRNA (cytosine1962-C5)-methyltransferase